MTSWHGAPSMFGGEEVCVASQSIDTISVGNNWSSDGTKLFINKFLFCFRTCHVSVTLCNVLSKVTFLNLSSLSSQRNIIHQAKTTSGGPGFTSHSR